MKQYSYLALGDSYTMGEQVCVNQNFPYQTVQILRNNGVPFHAPELIAVTGFTTDELSSLIDNTALLPQYDFVSLLIGVNNQYRGRAVTEFAVEFEQLLKRAIAFAGNRADRVYVLSIPDWGITPFAAGKEKETIAGAIDAFNAVCKSMSEKYTAHFIDITVSQRADGSKKDFLATDQLHPSGKEYAKWAALLSNKILSAL